MIAESTKLLTPGDNRPGKKLTGFHAFVVHETGNEHPKADAAMHRRYWQPGGDGRKISSVHFVADEYTSIQLLPTDEVGWHIGDGANQPQTDESFFTVAAEICVNSRSGFPATCVRVAKIAAAVLVEKGVKPIDGVTLRKHGSYPATTHKACPAHLNTGDWGVTWAQFVAMVTAEYAKLMSPAPGLAVKTAPRISRTKFSAVLRDFRSPAAALSDELYDICLKHGIDPAVALAFFGKESTFGKFGKAVANKSWGNVRTPFDPELSIPSDNGFARYLSWSDSLEDWCKRINQRYVKERGLTTIETIVPVYAPDDDGNDVQGYITFVRERVQKWSQEDAMTLPPGTVPVDPKLQGYWERSGSEWQRDRFALGYAVAPLKDGIQLFQRGALRLKADGSVEGLLLTEALEFVS